jgi:immune inhibitor A
MQKKQRNLWLLALGAAVVLLCVCLVGLAFFASSVMRDLGVFSDQRQSTGPVVVVAPTTSSTPVPILSGDTEALLQQADMPARDLRELALRLKPGVGDIPVVVNSQSPNYAVGAQQRFWTENSDTQVHRQITATLRYKTDHVYMWVENGVDLKDSDLAAAAKRFESKTYPTDREFFGTEWTPGVDNDVHLSILHGRDLGKNIAGYYSSADEFSHLINPYSNEKEMFYISVDDGSSPPNSSFYNGVLAHEFQHMIHWYNDRNEDSWVNEGMSELAASLNGFDVGGADIAFARKPDTQLTTWSDPSEGNAEHYGASYLFMQYFLGRFGEDLMKTVVSDKENGIAGFQDALNKAGRKEKFDEIFADWIVANYVNQPNAEPKGRFGYPDIKPPQFAVVDTLTKLPATGKASVSQYGSDYLQIKGQGDLALEFQGSTTVPLVNAKPHGTSAWWSNRGDDSDATLTRGFDLHGLTTASLTFSAWYDIEDGWDYAYVEVSVDGGKQWKVLPGLNTTTKNHAGNSFGAGFTGMSGGGKAADWVNERIDLTPFVGKEILLRFEYVTDDAVNGPGFMLDDIAIPELKYKDDAENGTSGWQAAGWVLTNNSLRQNWLVQAISSGKDGVKVQRMPVGVDGKGQLVLTQVDKSDEVAITITALAPVTTEKASYSYTLSQK